MKGRSILYSAAEMAWIAAHATLPCAILHEQFCQHFGRDDVSKANLVALRKRKRKGWKTGRTGRFDAGLVPHNKGRKGYAAPGSEKGWFRAGERRGVATRLYRPIGTERIAKGGYLQRKVNDDLPLQRRWRFVHVLRWEEANGPIPRGHALKCLDGNKLNTAPDNWALVSRALLPRLAGGNRWRALLAFDDAPPALKPALLAVARLEHATREKARE